MFNTVQQNLDIGIMMLEAPAVAYDILTLKVNFEKGTFGTPIGGLMRRSSLITPNAMSKKIAPTLRSSVKMNMKR